MNKKIPRFIILILIISFICVGCSDDTKNKTAKTDENVLHCKRKATTTDGASTSLTYSIYYDGDYVTKTVSVEKVTSDDDAILKKYQTAYENVFSPYKNIDYYDNKSTFYANRMTDWLCANAQSLPEYRNSDTVADMNANNKAYNTGIFIG